MRYSYAPCPACGVQVERCDLGVVDPLGDVTAVLEPCGHRIDGFFLEGERTLQWVLPGQLRQKETELAVKTLAEIAGQLAGPNERADTDPSPTTAEGQEWLDGVQRDAANGSLFETPSIREQLREHYQRAGLA